VSSSVVGAHTDLHSPEGGRRAEHPGRSRNPLIKVTDLAWLEFDKPDLARAEAFAHAFGFATALRSYTELHLRGADPDAPCVLIRRGTHTRFRGMAFTAADDGDLVRLADKTGSRVMPLPESIGGLSVQLTDPSGIPVQVVSGTRQLRQLPAQSPQKLNVGDHLERINGTQRPPRVPTTVQRLGHVVLQSTKYRAALDWYLDTFGMIVSDFLFFPGQRDRGPTMSFIRCDQGTIPTDHHTLALALGPANRYVHSAYQVSDLDALAAGGEYLKDRGYQRSWGIGRHIQGSQIFDYWRDPHGFMVEHFTDGDMFDNTLEPGWAQFGASGLAQWGPPATPDFLGTSPRLVGAEARELFHAIRGNNEFDIHRLIGLLKVAKS
jgi:hypothetical protein